MPAGHGEHDPQPDLWSETRALLEWLRERPAGFYGIDLGGSNVSLLPGLDAISSYLAEADPEFRVDQGIRETAAAFSAGSPFGIPAAMAGYPGLAPERRDALTAGLADLRARMIGRRLEYLRRTGVDLRAGAPFRAPHRRDRRDVPRPGPR